jgi:hypothetical protein
VNRLIRLLKNEDGIALATVIAMIAVLTVLSVTLIDQVTAESSRASSAVKSDAVYQAAEAGINDYIAKLTEDPQYYDHCVAKGESTRLRGDNGTTVSHSTSTSDCLPSGSSFWHAGVKWTYPYGKDWWFGGTGTSYTNTTALRGYAYNLMVTPPSAILGTNYLTVVSTGCKVINMYATPLQCDTTVPERAIEVHIRPTTPADFEYIVPDMNSGDPCYASNIYGTMYSSGNLYMCGAHVWGNLEAEQYVNGSYTFMNGSLRVYDKNHPDIRSVVKNPFSILDFSISPSTIKRLAALNVPSTDFEDATAAAWRVNFSSNGNVEVWKCVYPSGAPDPASSLPYCNDAALSGNVTLKQYTSTTVSVNQSTASFPSSGTIYIGPTSGGRIDKVTYTGTTSTATSGTFTGATCSACGSGGITHNTGETVSIYSGGITWPVPWYNGIPSIGAIYTGQDTILSWPTAIPGYSATSSDGSPTSQVNGRFTVASGQDIVIAGDNHYASEPSPDGIGSSDDDVLGLIASSDIWLAKYAPDQLWWRAATIALTGEWSDYCARHGCSRSSTSNMTFVGTMAYAIPGIMQSGNYGYDTDRVYRIADDGSMTSCPASAPNCASFDALKFLAPPSFPVINKTETTLLFHEVPPGYIPPAAP